MSPIRMQVEHLAAAKVCLVAGSGKRVFAELGQALALGRADVMAINKTASALHWPLAHIVSLHYQEVGVFRQDRRCTDYCQNHHDDPVTHSVRAFPGVDRVWAEYDTDEGRQGTSSLFAVRVALALGYERVILAGIPLDGTGRHYDPPSAAELMAMGVPEAIARRLGMPTPNDYSVRSLRRAWEAAASTWFDGRVTSMGDHYLAQLLGGPA